MAKTKKIKYKQANGDLSDYIAIGADAANVDLAEGVSLEELNEKLVRFQGVQLQDSKGELITPSTLIEMVADVNDKPLFQYLDEAIIQYKEMPAAGESYSQRIFQYTGDGTSEFKKGHFYQCQVSYLTTGGKLYEWIPVEVQDNSQGELVFDEEPTEGSSNLVTSGSIKKYVDDSLDNYYTKTETEELLNNVSVDLSNYYTKEEIDAKIGDIETLLASI